MQFESCVSAPSSFQSFKQPFEGVFNTQCHILASFHGELSIELFRHFHEEVLINTELLQKYRNNKKVGIRNEEGAFRDLKYTIGMLYFHSANQELIRQEIYASLILHNYCRFLVNNTPPPHNKKWKWRYKTNFKLAVTNIRRYMNDEINEEELIRRIIKGYSQ